MQRKAWEVIFGCLDLLEQTWQGVRKETKYMLILRWQEKASIKARYLTVRRNYLTVLKERIRLLVKKSSSRNWINILPPELGPLWASEPSRGNSWSYSKDWLCKQRVDWARGLCSEGIRRIHVMVREQQRAWGKEDKLQRAHIPCMLRFSKAGLSRFSFSTFTL